MFLISEGQIKALWCAARNAGLTADDLHAKIEALTGKKSVKDLSYAEASRLLNAFNGTYRSRIEPGSRLTGWQAEKIRRSFNALGWSSERQNAFLQKRYKAQELSRLNAKQASQVIEALKQMIRGGRAERKMRDAENL